MGDAVASPKTTLAWVITVVGAPEFILGWLVPVRESGSLIPQLFIGGMVRRLALRKWVWVMGSVLQSAAILGIGAVVLLLEGKAAGFAILGLVIVFSIARGFCSVAYKDVLGKTVPMKKRGQLIGWTASAAGIGLFTFVLDRVAAPVAGSVWFLPLAYFVLAIAHSGVRIGRKIYVVDLASGNQRTDYVAISNSLIGVLLLAAGSVGALVPLIGNAGVIGLLALTGLAGALLGTTLPDA